MTRRRPASRGDSVARPTGAGPSRRPRSRRPAVAVARRALDRMAARRSRRPIGSNQSATMAARAHAPRETYATRSRRGAAASTAPRTRRHEWRAREHERDARRLEGMERELHGVDACMLQQARHQRVMGESTGASATTRGQVSAGERRDRCDPCGRRVMVANPAAGGARARRPRAQRLPAAASPSPADPLASGRTAPG